MGKQSATTERQVEPGEGLAAIAKRAGVVFGAAAASEYLDKDPAYAALYQREVALLSSDWAMKFDFIRPSPDRVDFSLGDRLLAIADKMGMPLQAHTLIWNDNLPPWLKSLSARELRSIFDRHIDETVARYKGRLHSWDIVNEPIAPWDRLPGGYRNGPWFKAYGVDYIARAFHRASAIDRSAQMMLNEAQCERDDDIGRFFRKTLLDLLDRLLDKGVRIDVVGLQGHLQPHIKYDDKAFQDFLYKVAERGVRIHISELDVNDLELDLGQVERDRMTARRYRDFVSAAIAVPAVSAVITWQLADHYSWYRGDWFLGSAKARQKRYPARPLPFDDKLRRNPAWQALADAFASRRLR